MSHISQEQRYEIQSYLQQKIKISKIAEYLGRPKKTIYQEIKRNSDLRNGEYKAELAQRKYEQRMKEKKKSIRFTQEVKKDVITLLKEDYSPEQISANLKKDGKKGVSHETIYQFVWFDKKKGGKLHKHLRNQGKRYRKRGALKDNRGIIPERKSIEQRPDIVETRSRIGDYEVDLVSGAKHKGAILTLNERATGLTHISLLKSKNAEEIKNAIISLVRDNNLIIYTLTSDNGKEFSQHEAISKALKIDYYYARPYHSWERGSNENYNRLLRQYYPKGSDFTSITKEQLIKVQDKLNRRPRKRYGFKSPLEVYEEAINAGGKINYYTDLENNKKVTLIT